ncbi:hypothetical protein CA51_24550 [Rosistilla oblonga]|nr:hypothetical protein CA51_24550 [Rosistilla oblonga]
MLTNCFAFRSEAKKPSKTETPRDIASAEFLHIPLPLPIDRLRAGAKHHQKDQDDLISIRFGNTSARLQS